MFGLAGGKQRAGKPIAARTINRLIAAVDGLTKMRVENGLEIKWVAGIPFIRGTGQGPKCMQVGGGGITAFNATTKALGSGTCRVWDVDVQGLVLVDTLRDITVYNNTLTAIGAGKWGQYKIIDTIPIVDVESCS